MRPAWINLQGCVRHNLGRAQPCRPDRHDLVVVAVYDQGWYVYLLPILGVIHLRELLDAIVLALDAAQLALQPERFAQPVVERVPSFVVVVLITVPPLRLIPKLMTYHNAMQLCRHAVALIPGVWPVLDGTTIPYCLTIVLCAATHLYVQDCAFAVTPMRNCLGLHLWLAP